MDAVEEREFTEFVARSSPGLLRVAYALTGNQHAAEDLLQTALAKAASRWSRIRGDAGPYVRRILYHDHISAWRRRRRRAEWSVAELPELPVRHDGPADRIDNHLLLRQALLDLPPRQRAVLVLRYLEDLSEQQVADVLGCSVGTVGSQASRALAKLRRTAHASTAEVI